MTSWSDWHDDSWWHQQQWSGSAWQHPASEWQQATGGAAHQAEPAPQWQQRNQRTPPISRDEAIINSIKKELDNMCWQIHENMNLLHRAEEVYQWNQLPDTACGPWVDLLKIRAKLKPCLMRLDYAREPKPWFWVKLPEHERAPNQEG